MHIAAIYVYPIKSCAGIALSSAHVNPRGFRHDRQWMIISQTQGFLTQRQLPKMATIQTHLSDDSLFISAQGMPTISISLAETSPKETILTKVWNNLISATDLGEAASMWFQHYLGLNDIRLMRVLDESDRSFVDSRPLLVISQASLDDLNQRMPRPLPMDRFRPNIVIQDCEAYAEDNWKHIQIGNIILEKSKPCTRCVITTTDQKTGKKRDKEPLKTLSLYRKNLNGVTFGHYFTPKNDGKINIGDKGAIDSFQILD